MPATSAACYWITGRVDLCLQAAQQGLGLARDYGVHVWDAMLVGQVVWAELTSGRVEEAQKLLKQMQQQSMLPGHTHNTQYHYQRFLEAMCRAAGTACSARRRPASPAPRDPGLPGWSRWVMWRWGGRYWKPAIMSELCAFALAHGIEADYVRHLIRVRQLEPPPSGASAGQWPWPMRIYSLGRFETVLSDQPLRFSGKAQRRPLELVKAPLALGGRGVPVSRLAEALWPDADGDAAYNAFVTTLQRLRKLLGGNEFLLLREGRLSFNPRRCWVDIWSFDAEPRLEQRLALYRGAFLAEDTDASHCIPLRERLRSAYLRDLLQLGRRLEGERRWADAITLYESGLSAEDSVEKLYRQLMVCHAALGQTSMVLATYQHCCKLLELKLNLRPSPETTALYRDAVNAASHSV